MSSPTLSSASRSMASTARHELFSADYREARSRFRAAARAAGAELSCFACPAPGPDGQDLFTDIARIGPAGARKVLVVMSGTHGIEGFAGSAIQTGLLRRHISAHLPPDAALLLIHALNPFGFAHLRRVNEDNVDLNRNFRDFSIPLATNEGYDQLADVIAPAFLGWRSELVLSWRIAAYRLRHGQAALQKAVTCGQYKHAQGLFYGGVRPAWSNQTLRTILAGQLAAAGEVAVVDLHTGLGPRGYGEIIVGDPPGTPAFVRAKRWWGDRVRSTVTGDSVSAHLSGTVRNAFAEALPGVELTSAGLEFGTLPAMAVFRALRAENWLHFHVDGRGAQRIRDNFRRAFDPDDNLWRAQVTGQGQEVVLNALRQV